MHVMGVLEEVIRSSPLSSVPTKGQMWNLSNHLTHLTNHSPNPSFLVRCDVFGRCILLPIASRIFVFDHQNRTRRFQQVPSKAFIPWCLFKASDMIFQWISHLLTLRLSSKTTTPCSWLVPFLARGGDVDYHTDSMGKVKRVKNFKELS